MALNPQILEWHLSAGGIVRAFAFLYAMTSIYAGYRVFVHDPGGGRRAVALGAFAFGLTVLTHPTYSLFVVVSYVLFWVLCDRSLSGFASGLAVGFGGALLASPWLVWVLTTHGIGVFTAASGTHGGVGGGASALAGATFLVLTDTVARAGPVELPVGIVTAAVGAPFFLYLLRRREVHAL